jgi:hypothetical protein
MMRSSAILCSSILLFCTGQFLPLEGGIELREGIPNPNDIQVVPVSPAPSFNNMELRLQYPDEGAVVSKNPVQIEFRMDWFPLGIESEYSRKYEIYNDPKGQSIHVFIDGHDYFEINEAIFDADDNYDEFFDQIANWSIPFDLSPGLHIIRAFPCHSFGESIKQSKCFVSGTFYYKEKKGTTSIDLHQPFLTYNEPQGSFEGGTKPILLDFFVTNCTLSKDGYKVRLTIDDQNQRFLYDWVPYYIYGLPKGTHKIRLELINPQNEPVPGLFNTVTRMITIY